MKPLTVILPTQTRRQLREEIAYLEARLAAIGQDGDCAYERSLGRYYDSRLAVQRVQLRNLNLNYRTACCGS